MVAETITFLPRKCLGCDTMPIRCCNVRDCDDLELLPSVVEEREAGAGKPQCRKKVHWVGIAGTQEWEVQDVSKELNAVVVCMFPRGKQP